MVATLLLQRNVIEIDRALRAVMELRRLKLERRLLELEHLLHKQGILNDVDLSNRLDSTGGGGSGSELADPG